MLSCDSFIVNAIICLERITIDALAEIPLLEEDLVVDGTPFPPNTINVLPAMSYCNFLIANNVVVAQKYYKEGMSKLIKEKDEEALKVLKSAFPKHHIVQINPLALNLYGGGIHCHTRNIPVAIN